MKYQQLDKEVREYIEMSVKKIGNELNIDNYEMDFNMEAVFEMISQGTVENEKLAVEKLNKGLSISEYSV
ncbi:hypothetical protein [Peribacillus frigoritolerans]|uniref:hypothetical protein n=1 Tax=Peribacillus frigoritolerans TaxID=450367 RepID=UPI002E1CBC9F|nr:hypothetical protein [Peribacillus frigoritolerans]